MKYIQLPFFSHNGCCNIYHVRTLRSVRAWSYLPGKNNFSDLMILILPFASFIFPSVSFFFLASQFYFKTFARTCSCATLVLFVDRCYKGFVWYDYGVRSPRLRPRAFRSTIVMAEASLVHTFFCCAHFGFVYHECANALGYLLFYIL